MKADVRKLKAALEKRGETVQGAALAMGYSKSGFSNVYQKSEITTPMFLLLSAMYGITAEEIEPDPEIPEGPKPAEEPKEELRTGVEYVELKRAVETGTRAGINLALRDDDAQFMLSEVIIDAFSSEEFKTALFNAFYGALKKMARAGHE